MSLAQDGTPGSATSGVLLGIVLSSLTYALVVPLAPVDVSVVLTVGGLLAGVALVVGGRLASADEATPPPSCRECGSTSTDALSDGFWRCRDCGNVYVRVGETCAHVASDPRVPIER